MECGCSGLEIQRCMARGVLTRPTSTLSGRPDEHGEPHQGVGVLPGGSSCPCRSPRTLQAAARQRAASKSPWHFEAAGRSTWAISTVHPFPSSTTPKTGGVHLEGVRGEGLASPRTWACLPTGQGRHLKNRSLVDPRSQSRTATAWPRALTSGPSNSGSAVGPAICPIEASMTLLEGIPSTDRLFDVNLVDLSEVNKTPSTHRRRGARQDGAARSSPWRSARERGRRYLEVARGRVPRFGTIDSVTLCLHLPGSWRRCRNWPVSCPTTPQPTR